MLVAVDLRLSIPARAHCADEYAWFTEIYRILRTPNGDMQAQWAVAVKIAAVAGATVRALTTEGFSPLVTTYSPPSGPGEWVLRHATSLGSRAVFSWRYSMPVSSTHPSGNLPNSLSP